MLDSPENVLARLPGAANHLEGYLPLLPIGRGPGQTFVDSYFSITGERYGAFPALEAVVDVQLDPAQFADLGVDDLIARHGYPVNWYTASADDLAAGVGFAWSPLIGTPPDCLACFFRQDWAGPAVACRPGGRAAGSSRCAVTVGRSTGRPDDSRSQPLRGPVDVPAARRGGAHRTGSAALAGGASTATRTTWRSSSTTGSPRRTPGAQLAIWLDDRQVFATAADWSGATGHHAVVDVSAARRGRHTMTAVLTPPTREQAPRA